MKILKRLVLPIFAILFLTSLSLPRTAQAQQDFIRTFSWEGLSLSLTPDQMVNALEGDGYIQFRVTEGKKKKSIYQRKTGTGSNKVQFTEKNGALIKLIISETRTGGKKNMLSSGAADSTLSSIKSKLGIDDTSCTPGARGGGQCNGQPGSATHINSFSVSVKPRSIKITLSSNPISQALIDSTKETSEGLASAYECLGTTDITSVKKIYECINSVTKELEVLGKARKISSSKHRSVYLNSPTTPCWQLVNFYKRGLSNLNNSSDAGPIPSCATFAAVIELAAGSPPFWSGCLNENESDEFLKSCIDGVNSSYFKLVNQKIFTCREFQIAYQTGVVASKDTSINISAVTPPECEHVITFAKSLRKPLTEKLLVCAGYDPDNAQEHILKCITSDKDLWLLKTCAHVQVSYRTKLMQSNYGKLPDIYRPIACDQTKDVLVKAEAVRERKKAEAVEEMRLANLRREDKAYMKEYMKEKHAKEMAEKYGDTTKRAATRTSKLEKEMKANGKAEFSCKATGNDIFYCPPTLEEIRLAMMRNHSKRLSMRMIDGHKIHGDLNEVSQDGMISAAAKMPGGLAIVMAIPNIMKIKYLGAELLYGEPTLLSNCTTRSETYYNCSFTLDLREYMDKKTIRESGYTVDTTNQLRFIRRKDYSYYFWIGKDGLWHSKATEVQIQKDQVVMKKLEEKWAREAEELKKEIAARDAYLNDLQSGF